MSELVTRLARSRASDPDAIHPFAGAVRHAKAPQRVIDAIDRHAFLDQDAGLIEGR